MINPLDPFDPVTQMMNQENHGESSKKLTPELTAKLCNVILFALLNGLVIMAAILVGSDFLKNFNNPVFEIDPLLAGLGIAGLMTSIILPPIIRAVPPDTKLNIQELCQKFQVSIIIKYAILEGTAFTAVFLNHAHGLFGLLIFVSLIFAMLMSYVTTNQIEQYIKHVRENSEFDTETQ